MSGRKLPKESAPFSEVSCARTVTTPVVISSLSSLIPTKTTIGLADGALNFFNLDVIEERS